MIRKYNFTHSSRSRIFLTSDHHFRHVKLLENRSALNKKINGVGFNTIEEHDETLINNWNRIVRPEDNVLFLGDFVLGAGDKSKEVCIELFNKLNGHITMLFGNHNSGVKKIYKDCLMNMDIDPDKHELYPVTWENKVTFVGNSMLAHIKTPEVAKSVKQNHFVFCAHFAHRIFIDSHKFTTHACGHSHGSDKESNPDWIGCKRLDVGVENFNFTPLPFDSYLAIMEKKNIEILDHHNERTNPSF